MKLFEVFSAEIQDLSSTGHGVCQHPSGRTVFVNGAWPGEQGEFKINRLKGWIGFASIVRLTRESAQRIEPACSLQGFGDTHCGGCGWMFIEYAAQLAAKQQRVENVLQRALANAATAAARASRLEQIWPAPQPLANELCKHNRSTSSRKLRT